MNREHFLGVDQHQQAANRVEPSPAISGNGQCRRPRTKTTPLKPVRPMDEGALPGRGGSLRARPGQNKSRRQTGGEKHQTNRTNDEAAQTAAQAIAKNAPTG